MYIYMSLSMCTCATKPDIHIRASGSSYSSSSRIHPHRSATHTPRAACICQHMRGRVFVDMSNRSVDRCVCVFGGRDAIAHSQGMHINTAYNNTHHRKREADAFLFAKNLYARWARSAAWQTRHTLTTHAHAHLAK